MIAAVDTNVLMDVLRSDAADQQRSRSALDAALHLGSVVISEPVYAELAAVFAEERDFFHFLADTRIQLLSAQPQTLYLAGRGRSCSRAIEYAKTG